MTNLPLLYYSFHENIQWYFGHSTPPLLSPRIGTFLTLKNKNFVKLVFYPQIVALLTGWSVHICQPILVHDPIGFLSLGCFSGVKHQGLLNPDGLRNPDGLVRPGRLPIPPTRCPVRPRTVGVFPVPRWEEVPLLLPIQGQTCKFTKKYSLAQKRKIRKSKWKQSK